MEMIRDNRDIDLSRRINVYMVIMLLGIMMSTYLTHSITIVWVVNLLGLLLVFMPFFRYTESIALKIGLLYVLFGVITIAINLKYMNYSAKSIGTNINILVLPVLYNVILSVKRRHILTEANLSRFLGCLSLLGTVAFVISLIIGYSDIISVFQGMNAYKANVSGFFYSKNIYGAFVSITMIADLYLFDKEGGIKRLALIGIKTLAVVLSFSRAALLQTGIILFVFIWSKKKRTIKDYLFVVGLGLLVIAAIITIQSNQRMMDFVMNSVLRLGAGDAGRQLLRDQAIERAGLHPITMLFGVGYAGIDVLDIDVDNTYLYLLFSGGLIKCGFFLYFVIISIIKILALRKQSMLLSRLCLAVEIAYFAFAFFESVAFLELGLLNLLYTIFILMIPMAYCETAEQKLGD